MDPLTALSHAKVIDPWTVLSRAGNIVQFVDFGSKLLSESHALYKSTTGALIAQEELELIIADLRVIIHKLEQTSLLISASRIDSNTKIYSELLCGTSLIVAHELLACLDKVKIRRRQGHGRVQLLLLRLRQLEGEIKELKQHLQILDARLALSIGNNHLDVQILHSTLIEEQGTTREHTFGLMEDQIRQRRNPQPLPSEQSTEPLHQRPPSPAPSRQPLQDLEMQAYPKTASRISQLTERLEALTSIHTTAPTAPGAPTATEYRTSVSAIPDSKCSRSSQSIGILLGTFLLSLTLGLWWFATHGRDMSAATGLVAAIVSMGAMLLVVLQGWHYKHCQCWDRSRI